MQYKSARTTAKGKYYNTRTLIQKVREFWGKGMNLIDICNECEVGYRTVKKILATDEHPYVPDKPDYQALYVIVSERGLPNDLASDEVLEHLSPAMSGSWIHGVAVNEAGVADTRKRLAAMSDKYGKSYVAKLTFVDARTFLEQIDD